MWCDTNAAHQGTVATNRAPVTAKAISRERSSLVRKGMRPKGDRQPVGINEAGDTPRSRVVSECLPAWGQSQRA